MRVTLWDSNRPSTDFEPVEKIGKKTQNGKAFKFNDLKAAYHVCEPYSTELESASQRFRLFGISCNPKVK